MSRTLLPRYLGNHEHRFRTIQILSINHEYIVLYAKCRRQANRRLKESNADAWHKADSFACYPKQLDASRYDNPDNDPRGPWKADPFDAPNVRPNRLQIQALANSTCRHAAGAGEQSRINTMRILKMGELFLGQTGPEGHSSKSFMRRKKRSEKETIAGGMPIASL